MLGQRLRDRREERGLSIDEVCRSAAIPESFLRKLEADDYSDFPALCYALGFLRSYCALIELDAEPQLDLLREGMRSDKASLREKAALKIRIRIPHFSMPNIYIPLSPEMTAWLAISALLAFGWVAYAIVFDPGAAGDIHHIQAAVEELRVPSLPGLTR